MIAMALACNPKVLIADEPTSALDVTIQAQILDLIAKLRTELGTAVILITHDLGVVAETAERVIVMYAGRKIEEAPVGELFAHALHPYTRGLMNSIPRLALMRREGGAAVTRLQEIPGMVPALSNLPPGCVFAPRCAFASDLCRREYPPYQGETRRPLGRLLALGPAGVRQLTQHPPRAEEAGDRSNIAVSRPFDVGLRSARSDRCLHCLARRRSGAETPTASTRRRSNPAGRSRRS